MTCQSAKTNLWLSKTSSEALGESASDRIRVLKIVQSDQDYNSTHKAKQKLNIRSNSNVDS